jgi:hypothetical protein
MHFRLCTLLIVLAEAALGAWIGWMVGWVMAQGVYDYKPTPIQLHYWTAIAAIVFAMSIFALRLGVQLVHRKSAKH